MKKILLVFFALATTLAAFSEDDDSRPNGIRFGYQESNLYDGDKDAGDNLAGFYVGFTRQKKISGLFRFETGLEYMMAGSDYTGDSKRELHYIVLPVQMHLKLGPFLATAGINADFKVAEKLTIAGQDIDINDDNKSSFMDCAADLGVGLKILFLTAEARYYWGLVDINDGAHNRYLQLGLKVSF